MATTEIASPNLAPSKRRRHPALGSRIAAAGLGATSMFAIVGLFGLRDRAAQNADTEPVSPPQAMPEIVVPPVKVVIHRVPASTVTAGTQPASTAPSGPIELTANTVVRTVTVTEAPRRRSSSGGSSGGGGGGGGGATPAPAPAPRPAPNGSSGGSN